MPTEVTETAEYRAVLTGASYLDNHPDVPPNWRSLININILDLSSSRRCILGQLYCAVTGTNADNLRKHPYHAAKDEWNISSRVALDCGLISSSDLPSAILTPAWLIYLEEYTSCIEDVKETDVISIDRVTTTRVVEASANMDIETTISTQIRMAHKLSVCEGCQVLFTIEDRVLSITPNRTLISVLYEYIDDIPPNS